MQNDRWKWTAGPSNNRLRYIHEVLFSLNTGLMGTELAVTAGGWSWTSRLVRMEMHINYWLHIRQTDFVRGYFAFYIPSIAAALCIWALLRLTANSRLTNVVLNWIAGPLTLLALPVCWQYIASTTNLWGWYGSQGWRYGASPFEAVVTLVASLVYLRGKRPLPWWTAVPLLAVHFYFWGMPIHDISFGPSSALGPVLGFCASLIWVVFVNQSKKAAPANVAIPA
jgi:hypothetical protein